MTADLIVTGGPIFTGEGSAALTGMAVLIADGKIQEIVPENDIRAHQGEHTQVLELAGNLMAPGFQDAHIHPVQGGVELLQCDLSSAANATDTVEKIRAYAASHPEEKWILGGGWSMDHFPGGAPDKKVIDAVVLNKPVLLSSRDHHSVWANSRAIELAGIDADTADPRDGRIERYPDGTPSGTFHEGAEKLFDAVRPAVNAELQYAGLMRAQEELLALGITGWQDALVNGILGTETSLDAYLTAMEEGTLKVHVRGAQWWWRDQGREQIENLEVVRERIRALNSDQFSLETVKIMVDGVAENFTAAMNAPYRDEHGCATSNTGTSFLDPQLMREYVAELDRRGFQVHFHALGDRAVAEALDAVEAARVSNGDSDRRHHLAHLQVVSSEDVPRFAELGASANIQALWACHEPQLDELTLPFLAEGVEARHYPFGEMTRAGVHLAAGSDWPVSSANPIEGIHVAVNRVTPGETGAPLAGAEQRLTLAEALASYTSGSAYVNHRDQDTGKIAPGYLADFVVIEPNPFELPAEEIYTAHVQSTWIHGAPEFVRVA